MGQVYSNFVMPNVRRVRRAMRGIFGRRRSAVPAGVGFVSAGPGGLDCLTLGARDALLRADVVIHDRLVGADILDLIPRGVRRIDVGKTGFGPTTPQDSINRILVAEALAGGYVVRLKGGDAGIFGRLDEETEALSAVGVPFTVLAGVTTASAAAASLGVSLTRRGRNGGLQVLTAHDLKGFAEQDWRSLARPGAVAAIYMGKRAARFLQGRLLMHGAMPETPVTVVENASLPTERRLCVTLGALEPELTAAQMTGPAILMLGLAPFGAAALTPAAATDTPLWDAAPAKEAT